MKRKKMDLAEIFQAFNNFDVSFNNKLGEGEAIILAAVAPVDEGYSAANVSVRGKTLDLIVALANAVNTIAEDGPFTAEEVLDYTKRMIESMKVVQTINKDKNGKRRSE